MTLRRFSIALMGIAAAALLVAVAFFGLQTTADTAHASGIDNLECSVSPSPPQSGGAVNTVTCTFDFEGSSHTFVATFTYPPLSVLSCTLDGNPISAGPCP